MTEQKIKQHLMKNGISQTWLSRETRIPAGKLSFSLNGKRKLTLEEYATICGVLGVNTDKFLKPRMPDTGKAKESVERR